MAYAEGSLALVTALNPHIGYLNAAAVAKESLETGKSIREIVLAKGLLTEAELAQVLDLEKMSNTKSDYQSILLPIQLKSF